MGNETGMRRYILTENHKFYKPKISSISNKKKVQNQNNLRNLTIPRHYFSKYKEILIFICRHH